MASKLDRLLDAFVSAASSDVYSIFLQSFDGEAGAIDAPSVPHLTDTKKLFKLLSRKTKQLDELTSRVDNLRTNIEATRQRVLDKLEETGCIGANYGGDFHLFHEELKNRLDSKVNHLTSLMEKKCELLEETKLQKDVEKQRLAFLQREATTKNNKSCSSSLDEKIVTWMKSRLGELSLPDSDHIVLDASKSSVLEAESKTAPENGTRIRCLIKRPYDCETSFGFDSLHPLGGSLESMGIAHAATRAMNPSVSVNHAVWKQLSGTIGELTT